MYTQNNLVYISIYYKLLIMKQNGKQKLFEVMSRLDKTFKINEDILSNTNNVNENEVETDSYNIIKNSFGRLTVENPIIPDAIKAISQNPKAVKFTNKQLFNEFANQQQYFSASASHCFYNMAEKMEWSKNGGKYVDPDSEKSIIVFDTGRDLVKVWDNKNSIGYIIPKNQLKPNNDYSFNENLNHSKSKQRLFEVMSRLDKTFKLNEEISIDVEVGDTIMMGKFKNSPTIVKSIEKDEHGMPTINGKKVVTFRKSTKK